jgi:hypothetical protein
MSAASAAPVTSAVDAVNAVDASRLRFTEFPDREGELSYVQLNRFSAKWQEIEDASVLDE